MNIITISREFGSGGRELGRLLAQHLGYDYFDRQLIADIARNRGLDPTYVASYYEHPDHHAIPLTLHNSFAGISTFTVHSDILLEQKNVVESIPQHSQHCVIVGRNADVLLSDYRPFTVFVCADLATKLKRCQERQQPGEELSTKELERKIHQVDRARRQVCNLIAGVEWGVPQNYQLVVNTSDWEPSELVALIAAFARKWFEKIP